MSSGVTPALEVRAPSDDDPHLPLADAVAVGVDDCAPLALETPRAGVVRVFFSTAADRDADGARGRTSYSPTHPHRRAPEKRGR